MLEIKNVSKTYRNAQVKAIDSINLTIEDGGYLRFYRTERSRKIDDDQMHYRNSSV